jgi:hypothetical protein
MPLTFKVLAVAAGKTDPFVALAYTNHHNLSVQPADGKGVCVLNSVGNDPAVRVRILSKARPGDVDGEESMVDMGIVVFEGNYQTWSKERAVIFMPSNEKAKYEQSEIHVSLLDVTCIKDERCDDVKVSWAVQKDDATVLDRFFKNTSSWWNDGSPDARRRTVSTKHEGDKALPSSRFDPLSLGAFDIHCPMYDGPSTGLPGWAFALPLALPTSSDVGFLHNLLMLGGARLGYSSDETHNAGVEYLKELKAKPRQRPNDTFMLLEALLEACGAPASFCTYAEDRSTGSSRAGVERYSLSPRYGAAGDCEDLAKLTQTIAEQFAAVSPTSGAPECVLAASDLARRYLFGVCIVAVNEGSFAAFVAKKRTDAKFNDDVTTRPYDGFLSHMVAVAVRVRV